MTMSSSNPASRPAVVILQGAWQTIEHYADLISKLKSADFLVEFPSYPSTNNIVPPTASLLEDVAHSRLTLSQLADAGHPIIVLLHSYGGAVGNDAIAGLSWKERGGCGGIVHLVYMAAFVVPAGNSVCTPFGEQVPPWLDEDQANGTCWAKDMRQLAFSDLSEEEANRWLAKMVACPTSVITTPVKNPPGPGSLSTYLVCKLDPILTTPIQEGLASSLGEGVHLEYVEAAHCAQLGAPDRIVEVIQGAWGIAQKEVIEKEGAQ